MIEHIVFFKFNELTTREQMDEAIRLLRGLRVKVPGIVDLQCNHNVSDKSQGVQVGLTVRFENQAALEAYIPHPDHQSVVSFIKDIGLKETIDVDFEI